MLASALALAALIAKLFPNTPTGLWLHDVLVDRPLQFLAKIERKHLIFILVALVAFQAFAAAAPFDLAVAAVWDVSIYVDIVAAVWTLAAVARGRAAWAFVKTKLGLSHERSPQPPARAARARSSRARPRPFANDDDRPVDFGLAACA